MIVRISLASAIVLRVALWAANGHAGSGEGLPGCPGSDPTAQENCVVAQELLDIYNGEVGSDTSLPPIGGPHGSYTMCIRGHNQSTRILAGEYEASLRTLEAKGDRTAARDAAAKYIATWRSIDSAY